MRFKILAISPGGGSTRIGLFENERPITECSIRHSPEELSRFPTILDQYKFRRDAILEQLDKLKIERAQLSCVVGRGGPFKPLKGGTYRVNERLLEEIRGGRVQSHHPSLLGAILAWELAQPLGVEAFFVDPVSVDEFWELSRLSGLPEIPRKALSHALNLRMVAKETARRLKKPYNRCNFLIAHLGTGITIAAHLKGQQVDASNANEDGPFSPQRTGTLPLPGVVELCYSGRYTKEEVLSLIQRRGGLLAYLGTDDLIEVEGRIDKGDEGARLVYDAMIYQIAKELGAYAVVLKGKLDALIITGGMANSRRLVNQLKGWVRFLTPRVFVYPGEHELKALALGALRVLKGEESVKEYE